MESSKVFVLCAVIATSFVVVHAVPIPGLLSQFFGGDDLSQPKQNADVNQLLRQYYLSPTSDPYAQAQSQYNPFAQQLNYPQPNYYPSGYADPGFGQLSQQQNQGYYPNPYGQVLPSYRGLDSSYGNVGVGNLGNVGALGSGAGLGGVGGLGSVASAPGGGPAARSAPSAPADDSHYSKQLDSLLLSSAKGPQSFANFRILPSVEADETQQVVNAEALPAQSALQQQAPATRLLPERAPTPAARTSSAEEVESPKQ